MPVVTTPAVIDATTVTELRAILGEWHSRGEAIVVVDMTATEFCDLAGLRELLRAHGRAVTAGGGLLVVMAAEGNFRHNLAGTSLEGIIPRFPTLEQALARVSGAAIRRLNRGSGRAATAARVSVRPDGGPTAENSTCAHCGAAFEARCEHARFCGSDCRAAWNRELLGDSAMETSAITWSIAAMSEATARLPAVKVWDEPQAFAAIEEAVWWITLVDATLVRYHPAAYDAGMAQYSPHERQVIEQALAGLLFVRNWIGRGAGLGEALATGTDNGRITQWTWRPLCQPAAAGLTPRAQVWELARYRAYEAALAGHTLGETFGQAATFLLHVGADAAAGPEASQGASRN